MDGTSVAVVVTSLLTFFTVVYQDWRKQQREERDRKWEKEDRIALAKKVFDSNEAALAAIAENTTETRQATASADRAYTEANHVNIKIENLNQRLLANEKKRDERDEKNTKEE